jgi:hypothetical protein
MDKCYIVGVIKIYISTQLYFIFFEPFWGAIPEGSFDDAFKSQLASLNSPTPWSDDTCFDNSFQGVSSTLGCLFTIYLYQSFYLVIRLGMSTEPARASRSPSSGGENNEHETTIDSEMQLDGGQVDGVQTIDAKQDIDPTTLTLSKKAQKRMIKAKKREEMKVERRAKEKEAKKAKKAAIRAAKEADEAARRATTSVDRLETTADGVDGGNEGEEGDKGEERARKRRKGEGGEVLPVDPSPEATQKKARARPQKTPIPKDPFGAKVVIDLGFDEKMTERVRSLCNHTPLLFDLYSTDKKLT